MSRLKKDKERYFKTNKNHLMIDTEKILNTTPNGKTNENINLIDDNVIARSTRKSSQKKIIELDEE